MITLKAPAKINWSLRVLGRRRDGYHEVESLMQAVGLYDTLQFSHSDGLFVVTDAPIKAADNLVMKAALALRELTGARAGARISLTKEIPVSAGLGGGSSDAACTLRGLVSLWGLGCDERTLHELAGALGSDVPFFMNAAPAVARGRGELLEPAGVHRSHSLVLAKPPVEVSAAWAYQELRAADLTNEPSGDDNIRFLTEALNSKACAPSQGGEGLINDLEGAVFGRYPEVGVLKEALLELGARAALMSGSGPTVFGLFEDPETAEEAALSLCERYWSRAVKTLV